jgi:hypothetical protein
MGRELRETDFTVNVDGIGTFTFGRRTMRDEISIQREYARILDGVEPTDWLATVGGWISVLSVLTVSAPPGWNIDEMDPTESATYERLSTVYGALREKERSFRRGPASTGESAGA